MRSPVAGKARVHELAKELGVESKVVLAKLKEMGEFVKSASSTVEAPVARRLKEMFPSGDPAASARTAPPPPPAPRPGGAAPRPGAPPAAGAAAPPGPTPGQHPVRRQPGPAWPPAASRPAARWHQWPRAAAGDAAASGRSAP